MMIMQPFLLDDKGESWPIHGHGLRIALGSDRSGDALADFVVRNMGFIRITPSKQSTWLDLNPDAVAPEALTGLLFWVHDNPEHRLVLRTVGSGPPMVVRRREEIHAVIGDLMCRRLGTKTVSASRFLRTRVPHDRSAFGKRLGNARTILASSDRPYRQLKQLENLFDGFITMSVFDADTGGYRINYMGERYGMFDASFCSQAEGKTFEATHDQAYGQWVAQAHDELREKTEPVTEVIHAKIEWPRRPIREFNYSRLLLPVWLPSGDHAIIGATAL